MSEITILDPDSPEFRAAIRSVCDEQSWIYGMSRSECEYIITQGVKAAAKPSEESCPAPAFNGHSAATGPRSRCE